jgi:hypothetical protein
MSAPEHLPPGTLAELLVSAAAQLAHPDRSRSVLAPAGVPVRRGRLHLGRLRGVLDAGGPVTVVAGFSTGCWLGPRGAGPPDLGKLVYRSETSIDARGRVVLDLRVRAWLGVTDPAAFDVVTVPAPEAGLLVVPVEEFARRWEVITR